ncbi:hypothetical protein KIPB_004043 [Kipferlia bialata]|uniref:Uncharacterized protein n=1 Tax=Kipferlia bialata TaxID=797122 RepID=A0A9K3CTV1_9EUKA|nr:hypothetical protein KIPB_004043 [Kipferlia bialata]|eukprot:g4043.t1
MRRTSYKVVGALLSIFGPLLGMGALYGIFMLVTWIPGPHNKSYGYNVSVPCGTQAMFDLTDLVEDEGPYRSATLNLKKFRFVRGDTESGSGTVHLYNADQGRPSLIDSSVPTVVKKTNPASEMSMYGGVWVPYGTDLSYTFEGPAGVSAALLKGSVYAYDYWKKGDGGSPYWDYDFSGGITSVSHTVSISTNAYPSGPWLNTYVVPFYVGFMNSDETPTGTVSYQFAWNSKTYDIAGSPGTEVQIGEVYKAEEYASVAIDASCTDSTKYFELYITVPSKMWLWITLGVSAGVLMCIGLFMLYIKNIAPARKRKAEAKERERERIERERVEKAAREEIEMGKKLEEVHVPTVVPANSVSADGVFNVALPGVSLPMTPSLGPVEPYVMPVPTLNPMVSDDTNQH